VADRLDDGLPWKGDVFVGAWTANLAAIDRFYGRRPAQLNWIQNSADPQTDLCKARKLGSVRGSKVTHVVDEGIVQSIDVLVKGNRWVHIERGRVE
jgi:hypothetical protein